MNPVSFWGLDKKYSVEAVGTAACYDIIHQMNAVSFIHELENKADGMTLFTSGIDNVIQTIHKIMKHIRKTEED